jgi:VIT1/CCC1 family predicted Fe2+/Mn2+ transporter
MPKFITFTSLFALGFIIAVLSGKNIFTMSGFKIMLLISGTYAYTKLLSAKRMSYFKRSEK